MTKQPLNPRFPADTVIKIIGLGGVGSIVGRYLSIFCAAQNVPCKLVFMDGDEFEPKNSSRMFFGDYGNKAEVVRKELLSRFQDTQLALLAVPQYVTKENVAELISDGNIVVLCLDNHVSRQLINEHCRTLENIVLISGGNQGVEPGKGHRGTYGNVQIYIRKDGQDVSPDLTRFHPEIRTPADKHPSDISCTEALESTPQILFANLAVASALCNTLYLYLSDALPYSEVCLDIAEGKMNPVLPMNL